MFELTITPALIALTVIMIMCLIFILTGVNRYVAGIRKYSLNCSTADKEATEGSDGDVGFPAVSIIVYACDDDENLETLLPQLLEQDYPANTEVILVNDGAHAGVDEVVARLESRFNNLYMTFVPDNSRNLSRRKLALTLGIKAARYDVVALTGGCCRVPSSRWLRSMIRPIAEGKDITLGYSYQAIVEIDDENKMRYTSPLSLWKSYDTLRNDAPYLAWAIAGRPYRGNGFNLAYRRSVFFNNKGFSKSLNLKYGDDDLFIHEVANRDNTSLDLSRYAMVAVLDSDPSALFRRSKLHYAFTAKFLPAWGRRLFALSTAMWWITFCAGVALSLLGWPSVYPLIAAVVLWLVLRLTTSLTWRRTSKTLKLPFGWAGVLFFPEIVMLHPIYSLYYKIIGRKHRSANFTWS